MAEQLHTAGRVHNVVNIRNFIELLGEEVEDSTEDLIEHVAKLYAGPDRNAETNEDESKNFKLSLMRPYRLYKSFICMRSNKKTITKI